MEELHVGAGRRALPYAVRHWGLTQVFVFVGSIYMEEVPSHWRHSLLLGWGRSRCPPRPVSAEFFWLPLKCSVLFALNSRVSE